MTQEHWLLPQDLVMLNNFNHNFVGLLTSILEKQAGHGVIPRRPFGGISILMKNEQLCNKLSVQVLMPHVKQVNCSG